MSLLNQWKFLHATDVWRTAEDLASRNAIEDRNHWLQQCIFLAWKSRSVISLDGVAQDKMPAAHIRLINRRSFNSMSVGRTTKQEMSEAKAQRRRVRCYRLIWHFRSPSGRSARDARWRRRKGSWDPGEAMHDNEGGAHCNLGFQIL